MLAYILTAIIATKAKKLHWALLCGAVVSISMIGLYTYLGRHVPPAAIALGMALHLVVAAISFRLSERRRNKRKKTDLQV